jgi:hypothetical protein
MAVTYGKIHTGKWSQMRWCGSFALAERGGEIRGRSEGIHRPMPADIYFWNCGSSELFSVFRLSGDDDDDRSTNSNVLYLFDMRNAIAHNAIGRPERNRNVKEAVGHISGVVVKLIGRRRILHGRELCGTHCNPRKTSK